MTASTLTKVLVLPLFLIALSLIGAIKLTGTMEALRQVMARSIQQKSTSAESLVSCQISPCDPQLLTYIKTSINTDKKAQVFIESLWSLLVTTFWSVIGLSLIHCVVCINIFHKQRQPS